MQISFKICPLANLWELLSITYRVAYLDPGRSGFKSLSNTYLLLCLTIKIFPKLRYCFWKNVFLFAWIKVCIWIGKKLFGYMYEVSPDSNRTGLITYLGFVCEVAWYNKICSPSYILHLLEKHLPCTNQQIGARLGQRQSSITTPSRGVVFSPDQCPWAYCRRSAGLVRRQSHPVP